MKHLNLNALLVLVLFVLTCSIGSCSKDKVVPSEEEDDEVTVVFEDASLEAFIKQELGVATGVALIPADLAKLTTLNIRGSLTSVTSLKGLEYATELTLLDFGGNPVSDLTPIKDLKKITYLRMNETEVTNLSPISEYTTLTYFNANQASPGISDLTPLSKNLGMQTMILRAQPLGNQGLQGIANFTKLYRLNIRNTGVTDISVIGELLSKGAFLKSTPGSGDLGTDPTLDLQQLEITNCEVIDPYRDNLAGEVSGACSTPSTNPNPNPNPGEDDNIEVTNFASEELATFIRGQLSIQAGTPITRGDLRSLSSLDLRTLTTLNSLAGLEYATEVTSLRIDGTQVVDISPISGWTKLTYFNANRAGATEGGITDLSPLSGSKATLGTLIVRGNQFGNAGAAVIAEFTKLHRLNVRNSGVTSAIINSVIKPLLDAGALQTTTEGYSASDSEIALQGNGIVAADAEPISTTHYPNRVSLEY